MKLYGIEGNRQKLDGGAMFGNAPKVLWSRWAEADESNRIDLSCRALLIECGERRILCETGIGAFFEPRLRERFGVVEGEHVLLDGLIRAGTPHDQVTDLVLSHLHFDHAGGLLTPWGPDQAPQLLFPRATFYVSRAAWDRARSPHPRDRASFIPELPDLLEGSGRLRVVEADEHCPLGEGFRFHYSEGHTPGLMLLEARGDSGGVIFLGDLVPGVPWVRVPITMGYDRFPEQLIDEKRELLTYMEAEGLWAFYTHDAQTAMSELGRDDWGRLAAKSLRPWVWGLDL